MKTKTLEIPIYETPEGNPTCARDLRTGQFCMFLMSQRMGTEDVCGFLSGGSCCSAEFPVRENKVWDI